MDSHLWRFPWGSNALKTFIQAINGAEEQKTTWILCNCNHEWIQALPLLSFLCTCVSPLSKTSGLLCSMDFTIQFGLPMSLNLECAIAYKFFREWNPYTFLKRYYGNTSPKISELITTPANPMIATRVSWPPGTSGGVEGGKHVSEYRSDQAIAAGRIPKRTNTAPKATEGSRLVYNRFSNRSSECHCLSFWREAGEEKMTNFVFCKLNCALSPLIEFEGISVCIWQWKTL